MASVKCEYWLTEDGLVLLEGWARDGLTDEQISHNMNIAYSTLRIWKEKYPAISAALKKGKDVVDYEVENALLKKALSGDVGAAIFWLKNRRPKKWRDKPIDDNEDALAAIRELIESNKEAARAVQQQTSQGNA